MSQRSAGHLADRVAAVAQQLPERLGIVGAAGEAAAMPTTAIGSRAGGSAASSCSCSSSASSASRLGDSLLIRSRKSAHVRSLRFARRARAWRSTSSSESLRSSSTRLAATAMRRLPGAASSGASKARTSFKDEVGERVDGRVVEQQRRRQRVAEGRAQRVAQLDREQRVEPELAERRARVDACATDRARARATPVRARRPRPASGGAPARAATSCSRRSTGRARHSRSVAPDGRRRARHVGQERRQPRRGAACSR